MPPPWLVPLTAAIASLLLGIFVHARGPAGEMRSSFVFLAATLCLWNLFFVTLYSVNDFSLAFELARVLRVGSLYMVPAVLHSAIAIRSSQTPLLRRLIWFDYGIATLFVGANIFDVFVDDLRPFEWGWVPVATPWYRVLTVYTVVNFFGSILLLLGDYIRTDDPKVRKQIGLWLIGMLVALPLGLTNMLPVYGFVFPPLGNLGAAIWAGFVGYAIVRHHLMDIDVFITKSIAYAGVTLVVVVPAVLVSVVLQRWIFGRIDDSFTILLALLFLSVSVFFPTALVGTQQWLARSLFRQTHETRAALARYSLSIIRIIDKERLVEGLCRALREILSLTNISVFMLSEGHESLGIVSFEGARPMDSEFGNETALIRWLSQRSSASFVHEPGIPPSAKQAFERNKWELCLPLTAGRRFVGFIALGRRSGRLDFALGDIDHLSGIADQVSIALENIRLNQEVGRSRAIIDRSNRLSSIGILAAGIAHEIRNPLVSIHTFFQMAPQRLGDEEFMTSFLALAGQEVQRISNLIEDLLSFARSPSASVTEIDPLDVVGRAVSLLAPQARRAQVNLEQQSDPSLPLIAVDADQILQVVINLILNAIQATPTHGTVGVTVSREVDIAGDYVHIKVSDTGPGIPPENREAIFNPFFTTKERGTGLGLAIAHRIVSDFGGFISVESQEGRGSTFTVSLPAAQSFAAAQSISSERVRA